jgi:hypothetical protein
MIGCGTEIVYVGITNDFRRRSLQSLGRCYHRVADTTLPWSLALAPWGDNDGTAYWEASAIRAFAPFYNRSVPSIEKKNGDGAVKLMKTRIRLLAQPKSMRSIIDVTHREQRHGLA